MIYALFNSTAISSIEGELRTSLKIAALRLASDYMIGTIADTHGVGPDTGSKPSFSSIFLTAFSNTSLKCNDVGRHLW
jgi:hypothetical protein